MGIVIFLVLLLAFVLFSLVGRVVKLIFFVYKIALRCVIINKGEGGNWWKGLIPFYNMYTYYHLCFNHKTAILFFVANTILTVLYFVMGFVLYVAAQAIDTLGSSSSVFASPYSSYSSASNFGVDDAGTIVLLSLFFIFNMIILINAFIKAYVNAAMSYAFGMGTVFIVSSIFFGYFTNSIIAFNRDIYYEDELVSILPD